MPNITIQIDTKIKNYLTDKGLNVTEVAQHLLDIYIDRMLDTEYISKSTKQDKIDKLIK